MTFDRGEWETRAAERNSANWDDYAAGMAYDAPRKPTPLYLPRTVPLRAEATIGADDQLDFARATLVIMTPDGERHTVEVNLYVSAMDAGYLVLDVDTSGVKREVQVVANDDDDHALTVGVEA